ncbi:MAG: transglycosylase SLT domain-containing protein [Lachnospiraceae bacterium]|nr:transglycosylase SLT domain-containing protein [Lachnospiraceae bacterium]
MRHGLRKCLLGLLCGLCIVFRTPQGTDANNIYLRQESFAQMLDEPCRKYHLPKLLVMAIARQESGYNPWVINIEGRDYYARNREEALQIASWALRNDRSFDVGLMQINSYWIKKYNWPLPSVIEPKYNILIGCWILAGEIRKHGYNWKAIAYYHTPLHRNPERGIRYARSVVGHIHTIHSELQFRRPVMPVPDFNQSAPIAMQVAYTQTQSGVLIRDLPGENVKATLISDRLLGRKTNPPKKPEKTPEKAIDTKKPRTLGELIAERKAAEKKTEALKKEARRTVVAETMLQKMREAEASAKRRAVVCEVAQTLSQPSAQATRTVVAETMLHKMREAEARAKQKAALPEPPRTVCDKAFSEKGSVVAETMLHKIRDQKSPEPARKKELRTVSDFVNERIENARLLAARK